MGYTMEVIVIIYCFFLNNYLKKATVISIYCYIKPVKPSLSSCQAIYLLSVSLD